MQNKVVEFGQRIVYGMEGRMGYSNDPQRYNLSQTRKKSQEL